ncbi:MAG: hypothetical protein L6R39_000990 [Caloplaca ligustica]|nr:MAG: hypothetical protein L6R39_000990 [Caloplaca ligustica]
MNTRRQPVPYSVRVKASTQGGVNGIPSYGYTESFLSIIINETEGFIMVPQAHVPSSMCNLTVVFEDSVELLATKVFESTSGWAIAKYDPALINGPVERATFSDVQFEIGDKMTIYRLGRYGPHPCIKEATVTQIDPLTSLCDSRVFHHPIHLEVLYCEEKTARTTGMLLDHAGNVIELWLPFSLDYGSPTYVGIPASVLQPTEAPRLLDVFLGRISKNDAIAFGVPKGI